MRASGQHDPSPVRVNPTPRREAGDLAGRWWDVIAHPSLGTFDRQQAAASWRAVWWSVIALAVVEALAVAYITYGPSSPAGYSSLPVGPKLHLPRTPLLPLAALVGSIAQFFVFVALLRLSARLFGGHGAFKTLAYLFALFWVPLMALSDIVEFVPAIGTWLAVLVRLYALSLCVLALASAQRLRPTRAWAAFLAIVFAGLLLGAVVLAVAYTSGSVKMLG